MKFKTRFAPSPTGPLHLGHAYSAIYGHDRATEENGKFLLRVEDIDPTRCRPEYEKQIYDDLAWLGLDWSKPVMRQSERLHVYAQVLDTLWADGLLYACDCSRKLIRDMNEAQNTVKIGPDGPIYPGTCRNKPRPYKRPTGVNLRLDIIRFVEHMDLTGQFFIEKRPGLPDKRYGVAFILAQETIGDIVLARADMGTSYHLSVVLDDADQGITHVIRGKDLFDATWIHVILQKFMGLPTPIYEHHRLITDETGKRLAKRDDARAIAKYRAEGVTPEEIRQIVGLGSPPHRRL